MPVRLVLAVQDELYIEPFMQYVHSSEFDRRIIITGFSRQDAFELYMKDSGEMVDIVLAEPTFLEAWQGAKPGRLIVVSLCERGEAASGLSLDKYQPLHPLLFSLLNMVRGDKGKQAAKEAGTVVIGLHSMVGGLGKSTVSWNIAKQLASEGAKVFYLSLETVNNRLIFEGQLVHEGQRGGLARLLYDLKSAEEGQQELKFPISAYACRHPLLQGDLFAPLDNLDEMLELQRKETMDLIEFIAASGLYDAMVIDTDTYPNERAEAVLERADKLVWLVTDDDNVMRKTSLWFDHLERSRPDVHGHILSKSLFAFNQYTGEEVTSLPGSNIVFAAMLSYIPAWKNGIRQFAAMHSPLYQRDVQQLCCKLYGNAEVLRGGNIQR
ncbi:hypothetical protein DMN77_08275 [Paenibacillus sp. 79R4]|uniref:hypothetical protein n=1 Tax=Paenibacillus sp. 79R4 TaxID=2212847 RepID=UPI0015BD853D|nr:hypothetical protein [Paenibacillus sp. 79R4]NWL87599.1 hypothetical protein [Paenibacillus sp. 79R4]